MTFTALCGLADFDAKPSVLTSDDKPDETKKPSDPDTPSPQRKLSISGLVYNIQLILPDSRDPKVYDALFESLKKHLS